MTPCVANIAHIAGKVRHKGVITGVIAAKKRLPLRIAGICKAHEKMLLLRDLFLDGKTVGIVQRVVIGLHRQFLQADHHILHLSQRNICFRKTIVDPGHVAPKP